MSEWKEGRVTVELPESVKLSERAGKISKKDVSRLLKAPRGMGLVVEHTAVALKTAGPSFVAPIGMTPESLRALGIEESNQLERIIHDLLRMVLKLRQGKLLIDHETHLQLRMLKDQVRVQAKYNPQLLLIFASLLELFDKSAVTRKENRARARKAAREVAAPEQAPQEVSERPPLLNLVKRPEVAW